MSQNLSDEFVTKNMPEYRSHKIVRALQISGFDFTSGDKIKVHFDGLPSVILPRALVQRYNPVAGDYLVIYDDGYESFSPRAAFAGGYDPVDRSPQDKPPFPRFLCVGRICSNNVPHPMVDATSDFDLIRISNGVTLDVDTEVWVAIKDVDRHAWFQEWANMPASPVPAADFKRLMIRTDQQQWKVPPDAAPAGLAEAYSPELLKVAGVAPAEFSEVVERGDVVQLPSGSPQMTVISVSGGRAECMYCKADGNLVTGSFLTDILLMVRKFNGKR